MQTMVQNLPNSFGVYKYFDKDSKLLYIGKAKDLRKRVKSYWRFTPSFEPNPNLGVRITKMLGEAIRVEHIETKSEDDALILENRLIKELQPKYNILLRDDKTYPYIYIDESVEFPRFELVREEIEGRYISCYGPFPNGGRVLYDTLYELFPLVQKKSCINGKSACLFYQINRCLAPCEEKITIKEYKKIVNKAKKAMDNKVILIDKLSKKMLRLSNEQRFEDAIRVRDNIEMIKKITIKSADLVKKDKSKISPKISKLFELKRVPYRVESFDNSHMMGSATVGAMVVWSSGGWDRSSYRRYTLEARDEYAQMREMLSYRINSFGKNPPPDLWIIDGGDTLLQLALKLLDDVNIDIDVISISKEKLGLGVRRAKGSARDIIYTKESVFQLKPTDKRLHWVQRQRDEAHRFAVTFHQNRKRKEDLKNSLLEKKGIGLATIKRLLEYFGTFERINSASFDEISVASSKKVAKILKTESVKK